MRAMHICVGFGFDSSFNFWMCDQTISHLNGFISLLMIVSGDVWLQFRCNIITFVGDTYA